MFTSSMVGGSSTFSNYIDTPSPSESQVSPSVTPPPDIPLPLPPSNSHESSSQKINQSFRGLNAIKLAHRLANNKSFGGNCLLLDTHLNDPSIDSLESKKQKKCSVCLVDTNKRSKIPHRKQLYFDDGAAILNVYSEKECEDLASEFYDGSDSTFHENSVLAQGGSMTCEDCEDLKHETYDPESRTTTVSGKMVQTLREKTLYSIGGNTQHAQNNPWIPVSLLQKTDQACSDDTVVDGNHVCADPLLVEEARKMEASHFAETSDDQGKRAWIFSNPERKYAKNGVRLHSAPSSAPGKACLVGSKSCPVFLSDPIKKSGRTGFIVLVSCIGLVALIVIILLCLLMKRSDAQVTVPTTTQTDMPMGGGGGMAVQSGPDGTTVSTICSSLSDLLKGF